MLACLLHLPITIGGPRPEVNFTEEGRAMMIGFGKIT